MLGANLRPAGFPNNLNYPELSSTALCAPRKWRWMEPAGGVLGTPGRVTDGEVTEVEGAGTGWIPSGSWENAAKLLSSPSWRGCPELWGEQRFPGPSRLRVWGSWQMDAGTSSAGRCHLVSPPCPGTAPWGFPLPQRRLWSRERGERRDEGGITPNLPWKSGFFQGIVLSLLAVLPYKVRGSFFFFPFLFLFWQRWSQVAQLSNNCLCTAAHTACGK